MPNPFDTTKYDLLEDLREIRNTAELARERVVQVVMRRNQLEAEAERLQTLVVDLEKKAALAKSINQPELAEQLRSERKLREAELVSAKSRFQAADLEAVAAKERLHEDEAQLAEQASALQARMVQYSGTQIIEAAFGNSDTEEAWNRATGKIRQLENEASARAEIAGTRPSSPSDISPVQNADDMLAALEAKVGLSQEPPERSVRYIEFDPPTEASATSVSPAIEEPRPVVKMPAPIPHSPTNGIVTSEELAALLSDTVISTEPSAPNVEPEPIEAAQPDEPVASDTETLPDAEPVSIEETPTLEEPSFLEETTQTEEPEAAAIEEALFPDPPAATFPTPIIRGDSARMPTQKRVRVAGIGTGGIFRGAHLPAYPHIPQAQLTALVDPDPEAIKLALRRYQSLYEAKATEARDKGDNETAERLEQDFAEVKTYEDIRQLLENDKPDLVDICTQPNLHVPLSIVALEADLNVMTEKPISRSWLESNRLIEAIKRTGKLYQHNENWLWERDYYTAKKLVDAGTIGEPIVMFLAQAHGGPEGNGKFWDPANGGGGALLDNGIHAIGAAWFVVGMDKKPTLVKAAEPFGMSIRMPDRIIDGRFQKVTVDDDAHILIRFEDEQTGAWSTAHVEGSWSERDSPETAIIGTTGKIVFKDEDGKRFAVVMDSYDREQRRLAVSGPTWQFWPSGHYGEILNMIECVRHGVPSICTAEFGADNSAIVGATYLSEKNGRRAVHINEFKEFAQSVADRYPNDPAGADNALVETLLSAVRDKK